MSKQCEGLWQCLYVVYYVLHVQLPGHWIDLRWEHFMACKIPDLTLLSVFMCCYLKDLVYTRCKPPELFFGHSWWETKEMQCICDWRCWMQYPYCHLPCIQSVIVDHLLSYYFCDYKSVFAWYDLICGFCKLTSSCNLSVAFNLCYSTVLYQFGWSHWIWKTKWNVSFISGIVIVAVSLAWQPRNCRWILDGRKRFFSSWK